MLCKYLTVRSKSLTEISIAFPEHLTFISLKKTYFITYYLKYSQNTNKEEYKLMNM